MVEVILWCLGLHGFAIKISNRNSSFRRHISKVQVNALSIKLYDPFNTYQVNSMYKKLCYRCMNAVYYILSRRISLPCKFDTRTQKARGSSSPIYYRTVISSTLCNVRYFYRFDNIEPVM